MSNYLIVPNAALTATADAIRIKSGSQATIEFDHNTGFKDAVDAIPSGGTVDMTPIVNALQGKGIVIPTQGTPSDYATIIEQLEDLILGKSLVIYNNDHITDVGNSAFQGSFDLESVNLPNAIVLGNYAFNDCQKLGTVVFPKVTTINQNAFQRNYLLTTADFGSATSIGANVFNVCRTLTTLILRSPTLCALSNSNAFTQSPFQNSTAATLYCPQALIESYKSATNWSSFINANNNSVSAIEGSQYENYYADGTPIPTT